MLSGIPVDVPSMAEISEGVRYDAAHYKSCMVLICVVCTPSPTSSMPPEPEDSTIETKSRSLSEIGSKLPSLPDNLDEF